MLFRSDKPSASDLQGFASREWLTGLVDPAKVATAHYFGATKFKEGKMVKYVREDVAALDASGKEELRKAIVALSAEAGLKAQREAERRDEALIAEGIKALTGSRLGCMDCHKFRQEGEANAPELTGYGSRQWLVDFIGNPAHERFYGSRNDRMPAYREEKSLSEREIGLVADWLRGEWYTPAATAAR